MTTNDHAEVSGLIKSSDVSSMVNQSNIDPLVGHSQYDYCLSKGLQNWIAKMQDITRSLLEDIKTEQLKLYGHVQRMEEERLPKKL